MNIHPYMFNTNDRKCEHKICECVSVSKFSFSAGNDSIMLMISLSCERYRKFDESPRLFRYFVMFVRDLICICVEIDAFLLK